MSAQDLRAAELKTQKDRVSYLLGTDMGRKMKAELERQSVEVDPEILARGIRDVFDGRTLLMTDAEIQDLRTTLQNEMGFRPWFSKAPLPGSTM